MGGWTDIPGKVLEFVDNISREPFDPATITDLEDGSYVVAS